MTAIPFRNRLHVVYEQLLTLPDCLATTVTSLKALLMSFLLGDVLTHSWMLRSGDLTKLLAFVEAVALTDDQSIEASDRSIPWTSFRLFLAAGYVYASTSN